MESDRNNNGTSRKRSGRRLEVVIVGLLVVGAAAELLWKATPREEYEAPVYDAAFDTAVPVESLAYAPVSEDSLCEAPQFPGGMAGVARYMAENIKYPPKAKENNVTGRVYVSFVVEKDGSLGQVKAVRDIGYGCGEEAVRVIKAMPRWKPGTEDGVPVRVEFVLPVMFDLQ